jgi:hypothetical protein
VPLSIEDYRSLTARAGTQMAGTPRTMPDPLFDMFKDAVDAYEGAAEAP